MKQKMQAHISNNKKLSTNSN